MKKSVKNIAFIGTTVLLILIICLFLKFHEGKSPAWQEQYDLGLRYLSEGNYQEAIIAFTAAIEIDAMRPEAYLKAAEAYEAIGDSEAAREVLEKGYIATGDDSLRPHEGTSDEPTINNFGDDNTITMSLEVPDLQDTYLVNKNDYGDDVVEYSWGIEFTDGVNEYTVSTSHFKQQGEEPKEISLHQFQSSVWLREGFSNYYIGDTDFNVVGNKLIWAFSIPDEYGFDVGNIQITGVRTLLAGNYIENSYVAAVESIRG